MKYHFKTIFIDKLMETPMSRQKKQIITDTETFICESCNRTVVPPESGTKHRNHCPYFLWSRHVEIRTGDRRSECRGLMEPITGLPFPAEIAHEKIKSESIYGERHGTE